jgi:hypothetical protein
MVFVKNKHTACDGVRSVLEDAVVKIFYSLSFKYLGFTSLLLKELAWPMQKGGTGARFGLGVAENTSYY